MPSEKAPTPTSTSRGRFSSALSLPVDMKTIDTKKTMRHLERYLKTDHARHQVIIANLVSDHLAAHRWPDPKVLQVDIEDLGVTTPYEAQRLVKKIWVSMIEDQKRLKEKNSRTPHQTSPKENEGAASPAPSAASSGSRSEGFSECWPVHGPQIPSPIPTPLPVWVGSTPAVTPPPISANLYRELVGYETNQTYQYVTGQYYPQYAQVEPGYGRSYV